jgi:hypothetical protein
VSFRPHGKDRAAWLKPWGWKRAVTQAFDLSLEKSRGVILMTLRDATLPAQAADEMLE